MRHCHRFLLTFSVLLSLLCPSSTFGQTIWTDTFSAYPDSTLPTIWKTSNGSWLVQNKQLCAESQLGNRSAFIPHFLEKPYLFTAQFQLKSDSTNVGFLFNSAVSTQAKYAMRIRILRDVVQYGYLVNGTYKALSEVKLKKPLVRDQLYLMRLSVSEETFSFVLNEEILLNNVALLYKTGFVGLENSGGLACFDAVSLYQFPQENAFHAAAWVHAIAPADSGNVWFSSLATHRLRKVDQEGNVLISIQADESKNELPFAFTSLASLPNGYVSALDTTQKLVRVFDAEGKSQPSRMTNLLRRPMDFTVLPDGRFAVADASGVVISDSSGMAIQITLPLFTNVLASWKNQVVGLDTEAHQIRIFAQKDSVWLYHNDFPAPLGEVRGLALTESALFVALQNRVVKLDLTGKEIASLSLSEIGGISPQRLSIHDQKLYIADEMGSRIVVSDLELTEPHVKKTYSPDKKSVTIQWQSLVEGSSHWELFQEQFRILSGGAIRSGNTFQFQLSDLLPETSYQIRIFPLLQTIPPNNNLSKPIEFAMPKQ